jgi:hypothetical protein
MVVPAGIPFSLSETTLPMSAWLNPGVAEAVIVELPIVRFALLRVTAGAAGIGGSRKDAATFPLASTVDPEV